MELESIGSPALWIGFIAFVLGMLALDLGVLNRKAHVPSFQEAAGWSAVWISLALVFAGGIGWFFGGERALQFTTGYLVEKTLSIDNLFVFVALFGGFAVPAALQHRVLFWGVLGAIVLRAIFVFAGAALLANFHWVIYVFGGILVLTAIKLAVTKLETAADPSKGFAFRLFRRFVPMSERLDGERFFTRQNGRWLATPLFAVLVLIEATDVVFAVDSIPAIFAITSDPFLVFTSNLFAILGLRSLYFVLAGAVQKFRYLKPALAGILGFVGTKMLLIEVVKVPPLASLAVIAAILTVAILASVWKNRTPAPAGLPVAE